MYNCIVPHIPFSHCAGLSFDLIFFFSFPWLFLHRYQERNQQQIKQNENKEKRTDKQANKQKRITKFD